MVHQLNVSFLPLFVAIVTKNRTLANVETRLLQSEQAEVATTSAA